MPPRKILRPRPMKVNIQLFQFNQGRVKSRRTKKMPTTTWVVAARSQSTPMLNRAALPDGRR